MPAAASEALRKELQEMEGLGEEGPLETEGVEGHLQDGDLETDGVEGSPHDEAEGEDIFGDDSNVEDSVADIQNQLEESFENGNGTNRGEPTQPHSPSTLLDIDGDSDVSVLWSRHVVFSVHLFLILISFYFSFATSATPG